MPVVEAARLCDRAAGGQILAKEIVAHARGRTRRARIQAGRRARAEGASRAGRGGRGRLGAARRVASLPLPPRLQELPPVGFVGRSAERERLRTLFDEASEGNRRLALVSGEPGIGKTRLSHPRRPGGPRRGRGRALRALRTRSSRCPTGPGSRRSPTTSSTRRSWSCTPTSSATAASSRGSCPRSGIASPTCPPPRETDPETERYLLWGAVAGLLGEASARSADRAGPRRPALGRQADALAPASTSSHKARACGSLCSPPTASPTSRRGHPLDRRARGPAPRAGRRAARA